MPRARLFWAVAAATASALAAPSAASACTISATGVAFGLYDPRAAAPDDGTGTVRLDCHPSVDAPVVTLGAGVSGSFAARTMTSGTGSLGYNLYTSATRTIVWGNGAGGTATVTLTGGANSGGVRTFTRTIYGRIPARQNVGAGSYADTIMVTVIF